MANIRISQLPTGSAITGSELVPVVQNGQTIQTTVSSITNSPSQTQTFLTTTQEASLPNSRYIGGGLGNWHEQWRCTGTLQPVLEWYVCKPRKRCYRLNRQVGCEYGS
jgi:hypothetical protein